jgi:predicted HicB family RNase H-like nuclease
MLLGHSNAGATMNVMDIDGFRAVVQYDPQIDLFRGEFVGLNGGADFYAASVEALREEGAKSLRVFLETCREEGIEPVKSFRASSRSAFPRRCTRGR